MTDTTKKDRPVRRPDCVTEVRRGNTVLVVSSYFKQDTTATAADKMMKGWKPKAQPDTSRFTAHDNPQIKTVILTGGKEAKKTVQTAAPCGMINLRNSGAGCRKWRKP